MTYSQNWDRMLREREEGRTVQPHTNPSLRAPDPTNATAPGSVNQEADTTLFDQYCAAKTEQGLEMSVDRETFDRQIAVQREKIEERLGRQVRFEVQVEDGKVRVVARKKKK